MVRRNILKVFIVLPFASSTRAAWAMDVGLEAWKQASDMFMALKHGDYERFLASTHPAAIAQMGGLKKAIETTKESFKLLEEQGILIRSIQVAKPIQVIKSKDTIQSLLPLEIAMRVGLKKIRQKSFLFGISPASGKTWTFIDLSKVPAAFLKKMEPRYDDRIVIPTPPPPTVTDDV
ncbi:MAG TPA: hypothetical protein VGF45_16170 [Polyangia bacterium]